MIALYSPLHQAYQALISASRLRVVLCDVTNCVGFNLAVLLFSVKESIAVNYSAASRESTSKNMRRKCAVLRESMSSRPKEPRIKHHKHDNPV